MKTRDVYLEQGKVLTDAGTHTIDISPVDPITELLVNLWADNGGTKNLGSPIPRIITKIEVVDGADVLFSMDGRLACALFYNLTGVMPELSIAEAPGYTQSANIPLRFGRWLWDPIFALDAKRFKNLQLKITWNLTAVNGVGGDGFISGSAHLTVIAKVMEGLATPPAAFLMHKDQYSWTTGASGDERIALPTDYPYTMLMIRVYDDGVNMSANFTNIKLNVDFDRFIAIDMEEGDLKNRNIDRLGLIKLPIIGKVADGLAREAWLSDPYSCMAIMNSATALAALQTLDAGQYKLYVRDYAGGAIAALTDAFIEVLGAGLFNCLSLPFGTLDDPDTYFMAPEHGDIKLQVTQGAAGAEANIVLTQPRAYAAA